MKRCKVTGKVRYESERRARRCMANASNRIRVYRCVHCDGLHVTDHEHGDKRS